MLQWMYGHSIEETSLSPPDLSYCVSLLALAIEYDVPALCRQLASAFSQRIDSLASDHSSGVIERVYALPKHRTEDIRAAIEGYCERNVKVLMSQPTFGQVLKKTPELAVKLLRWYVEEHETMGKVKFACTECGVKFACSVQAVYCPVCRADVVKKQGKVRK